MTNAQVDARARLYNLRGKWRPFTLISARHSITRCMDCGNRAEEIYELTVQVEGMSGTLTGLLLCRNCLDDYKGGR